MDNLNTAMTITMGFEGGGFDNVAGNFDGEGISAGALQWNLGQGTLQGLLKKYIAKKGSTGDSLIDQVATMGTRDAVDFAVSVLMRPHNWKDTWKALMGSEDMKVIQLEAVSPYAMRARTYQVGWGLSSVRSYCWFFDICVQNGSLKGVEKPIPNLQLIDQAYCLSRPENEHMWRQMILTNEQRLLLIASYRRALLAPSTFQVDIFNRKATIAIGKGYVHGKLFNLPIS